MTTFEKKFIWGYHIDVQKENQTNALLDYLFSFLTNS